MIGRLTGFGADKIGLTSSIRKVALCKVSPALGDLFFQGEALGASPVERCSSCKIALKDCRLCSADKALLTAHKEEEYAVLNTLTPNNVYICVHQPLSPAQNTYIYVVFQMPKS